MEISGFKYLGNLKEISNFFSERFFALKYFTYFVLVSNAVLMSSVFCSGTETTAMNFKENLGNLKKACFPHSLRANTVKNICQFCL